MIIADYENAVLDLLKDKAFFARVIMSMKKDFNFARPTAAVSVNSTGITLHLNKQFFSALSRTERTAVLEHEVLHLVHGHPIRFLHYKPQDRRLANVACDIAINQYIPGIPETFKMITADGKTVEGKPVTYEQLKKEIPSALPKMSSEYYFDLLKEEQEKNGGGGVEYELLDNHDQWDDSDLTEEQKEKFTKSHIKAILQSCSDKERSVVDKTIIDELFKSEINWKAQLRQFFANSEETFTETSRKKRNRRYGIIQPGHKNESKLKIAICADTSGSMSDESLAMIFAEVSRIKHENIIVYVIEADTKVQDCYEYKKGMKITAKGRGGTLYIPAFQKAKELKVDAFIYAGDFDCADRPTKPRFPVLWLGVGNQPPPGDFGRVVRLP